MNAAIPTVWQRLRHTRLRDAVRGRWNASLNWRAVIANAELPEHIAEVVGRVVSGARLWRSEKVEVAQELIAHFQDGLESGRLPQQLIESFGDPVAAAQLIRRAKKRGRPVAWHFWRGGLMILGGMCAAYILAGLYLMTGRPTIKVDYLAMINEAPRAVPEAQRAWPLYREALLALQVKSAQDGGVASGGIPDFDAQSGSAAWPETARFLRDHADSIAKLRTAAGRRELGFVRSTSFAAFAPEDRDLFGVTVSDEEFAALKSQSVEDRWLISTLIPDVQQLRAAAGVLACDVRRAVVDGEADIALADIAALLGVSRHSAEAPFFVTFLAANEIDRTALGAIQAAYAENPRLWSDRQLGDLAHAVASSTIDWRRGFTGEAGAFQDAMQRFYTDDGHGDGRLAFRSSGRQNVFELLDSITGAGSAPPKWYFVNDGLAMLLLPAANTVVASRKETTETYERISNMGRLCIETPLWKQHDLPADDDLLSARAGTLDKQRYLFVRLMVPAYESLRNVVAATAGERDGVLAGLALELYRRENGAWPETLAELSPRWLPEVPIDRITGNSLHYRVVDDRPVIYSVGVDCDDDGGRSPLGDDDAATPALASPLHFQGEPAIDSAQDGDWVIWSTAPEGGSGETAEPEQP